MNVVISTVAVRPFDYTQIKDVRVTRQHLSAGEYSLSGHETDIAVDVCRKPQEFLLAIRNGGVARALRKMAKVKAAHVVFGFSFDDLYDLPDGPIAINLIAEARKQYPSVAWHFAGAGPAAKYKTLALLRAFEESIIPCPT